MSHQSFFVSIHYLGINIGVEVLIVEELINRMTEYFILRGCLHRRENRGDTIALSLFVPTTLRCFQHLCEIHTLGIFQ